MIYKTDNPSTGEPTEIRKVAKVDEEGNAEVVALIGQVSELLRHGLIYEDNTKGNEDKWLVVLATVPVLIWEFSSLESAKEHCRETWG